MKKQGYSSALNDKRTLYWFSSHTKTAKGVFFIIISVTRKNYKGIVGFCRNKNLMEINPMDLLVTFYMKGMREGHLMENGIGYVVIIFLASIVNLFLAVYVLYYRRNNPGARFFSGLIVTTTLYSLTYAFELLSPTVQDIIMFLRIEYLGISFLPAMWLLLILQYTGYDRLLTKSMLVCVFFIPVLTLVIHYTNAWHHLFYTEVGMLKANGLSIALLKKGFWYWIHITHLYFCFFLGNLLLLKMFFRVSGSYKLQTLSMSIGSLLPLLGNVVYLAGYSPWGMDFSPVMLAFSVPIYAWGLFSFRLFELVPIARHKVFEDLNAGVIVVDEKNRIADFNSAATLILPKLTIDKMGQTISQVLPSVEWFQSIESNASEYEVRLEVEGKTSYYHARLSLIETKQGETMGKTIVLSDITEKVLLLNQLQHLATMDEITKIYNRRQFMALSNSQLEESQQQKGKVAVLMMDLDYFKKINDQYGHSAGDFVLFSVAQLCKRLLASQVVFGRYGGEEFAFYLNGAETETACQLAGQLCQTIAQTPILFEGQTLQVTASFGVAVKEAVGSSVEQLLREADEALYQAKAKGRNCVVLAVT